jgi:glycosyltransferase involved in cell wall biosynthesis
LESVSELSPQNVVLEFSPKHLVDFDFADARNKALSDATGRWIISLDDDETLRQDSIDLVKSIIHGDHLVGHLCKNVNHSGGYRRTHLCQRIFPNDPAYFYVGRVHERVTGQWRHSDVFIDHHDFDCGREDKNKSYLVMILRELERYPDDIWMLRHLAATYHQMGNMVKAGDVAERILELLPDDKYTQSKAEFYRKINATEPIEAC